MDMQHPWDGRDLTNFAPKTIHRIVPDQKKFGHKYCKKQTNIDSVSVTDGCCLNSDLNQKEKHRGLTVKVPVVLAEPQVEINLESFVKLQEPAIEVKRIRKNVELTQCEIVPSYYRNKKPVFKLFLAGFVRKNIEYATADLGNRHKIHGNIRHTTVKVPFSCITEITIEKGVSPSFHFQDPNPVAELEFLDPCTKLSRDQREFGNINSEFLNEKPFCELINTSVIELDIILDDHCFKKGADRTFRTLKEKMVVLITLKVLQNQQVSMGKNKHKDKDKKKEKHKIKHKHKHKVKVKVKEKEKEKEKRKKKDKDKDKDKDKCRVKKRGEKDKPTFILKKIIEKGLKKED
ncbi:hypothetical protein BKP37_17715 [Anaerobacillus alkalilacustris]|uniref:DUF7852 domain-containing protein n=1 Tax=Anaerobacillus alkalilacustris TaxID=393763 RepID=A0A1S2LFV8_9BACI|nr:hypothetical protein [Anaerobacillus alkalilacustris]OIJ10385.1 hypothetical protein BKP37_17715 [Anaerobacillus alkalilacustris]